MVERQHPGDELGRPVEVEQPPPQLSDGHRRRRDRLDDPHGAVARSGVPVLGHPVERIAGGLTVEREERVCRAARPDGGQGRRRARRVSPPRVVARDQPGPPRAQLLVERRERDGRLVGIDQTDLAARRERLGERRPFARERELADPRREPVAVPAVDRSLRRPEAGERVTPPPRVVEQRLHHRAQHAAPAVRRQDADDGDTRGRDPRATRDRDVERHRPRAADDVAVDAGGDASARARPTARTAPRPRASPPSRSSG